MLSIAAVQVMRGSMSGTLVGKMSPSYMAFWEKQEVWGVE